MNDPDPVAVMAEHCKYVDADGTWCSICYSPGSEGKPVPWPCVTYRLADALDALQQESVGYR